MSEATRTPEFRPVPPPSVDQDRTLVWRLPTLFRVEHIQPGLDQIVILTYDRGTGDWRIGYDAVRLSALLESHGVDHGLSWHLVRMAWGRYIGELREWLDQEQREYPSRLATAEALAQRGWCLITGSAA